MSPYYHDDWLTIHQGDVREVLPEIASASVDCIVTSPPYWGLRDYGQSDQLGLERTPEEYVANLVAVFRELRRVLKPSGTAWLNLGDSYASTPQDRTYQEQHAGFHKGQTATISRTRPMPSDLKPKDLVGIPWRVAFALQADGWYLRSDIIWAKPNPMPESVTDRPTKAHEYLFLLTKSARYYYDADAVREAQTNGSQEATTLRAGRNGKYQDQNQKANHLATQTWNPAGRNLRSVWTIATRPYPGAHFAVFPPELPERCIKAGSSERGVCPECGAPWERVVTQRVDGEYHLSPKDVDGQKARGGNGIESSRLHNQYFDYQRRTTGWQPFCRHYDAGYEGLPPLAPSVVLDPFAGSGTTGMVANRLSRRAILIDLNGDYLKQQLERNAQTPLGLTG